MGSSPHLDAEKYPVQNYTVGRRVTVFFGEDLLKAVPFPGTVLRDDKVEPHQVVLRLDDGRIILGSEANFSIADRRACPPKLRGARAIVSKTGYLDQMLVAVVDSTYECRGRVKVNDETELTYLQNALSELKWVNE